MFGLNKIFRKYKFGNKRVIYFLGMQFAFHKKKKWDETFFKNLPESKYPEVLEKLYERSIGHAMDIYHPKTYTEKMQWIKIFDCSPLKTRLVDKYLARDWVKEQIGEEYIVPMLGAWDRFEDIDFGKLPNRFVLKCNHGSGMNIIVKDKSKLDMVDARIKLTEWLKVNHAFLHGFEIQYRDVKPKIIAEQFMEDSQGNFDDYKIHCFDGEPKFISVMSEHSTRRTYYDAAWKRLPFYDKFPVSEVDLPKPQNFDKMLDVARQLSKGFKTVRVDLYNVDGKIYFGEMSFTDNAGFLKIRPEEWDMKLGEYLTLETDKKAAAV